MRVGHKQKNSITRRCKAVLHLYENAFEHKTVSLQSLCKNFQVLREFFFGLESMGVIEINQHGKTNRKYVIWKNINIEPSYKIIAGAIFEEDRKIKLRPSYRKRLNEKYTIRKIPIQTISWAVPPEEDFKIQIPKIKEKYLSLFNETNKQETPVSPFAVKTIPQQFMMMMEKHLQSREENLKELKKSILKYIQTREEAIKVEVAKKTHQLTLELDRALDKIDELEGEIEYLSERINEKKKPWKIKIPNPFRRIKKIRIRNPLYINDYE